SPVVPELPEEAAQEPAEDQVDDAVELAGTPVAQQRLCSSARIDRIEQQDEAEPDRGGEVARDVRRGEQRRSEHPGADCGKGRTGRKSGTGGRGGTGRNGDNG